VRPPTNAGTAEQAGQEGEHLMGGFTAFATVVVVYTLVASKLDR
jgi:hypothetical protein